MASSQLRIALALSLTLALAIGLFSLRVQSIFFAMVTLAVAYAFNVLASQLSWLTGGEDGRSFKVPEVLQPGFRLIEGRVFGVAPNGRLITYYLIFVVVAGVGATRTGARTPQPRASGRQPFSWLSRRRRREASTSASAASRSAQDGPSTPLPGSSSL